MFWLFTSCQCCSVDFHISLIVVIVTWWILVVDFTCCETDRQREFVSLSVLSCKLIGSQVLKPVRLSSLGCSVDLSGKGSADAMPPSHIIIPVTGGFRGGRLSSRNVFELNGKHLNSLLTDFSLCLCSNVLTALSSIIHGCFLFFFLCSQFSVRLSACLCVYSRN